MNKCLQCDKPLDNINRKFCCNSCSATYSNSRRIITQQQKNKISQTQKRKILEGTFVTKDSLLIIKNCKFCQKNFTVRPSEIDRLYCTNKCYLDDPNKPTHSGGYRKGSGNGKHGWYKGYWCDSSYELAFVIYNLDHNIKFERNKQGFEYEWKGKNHLYYPDFILEDGSYIEIKGFWTEQHEVKIKSFPNKLTVYFKDDIKPILEYVISKYGTDYVKLYEGNPYKDRKDNICKECGNSCKHDFCCRSCAGKFRSRQFHSTQQFDLDFHLDISYKHPL